MLYIFFNKFDTSYIFEYPFPSVKVYKLKGIKSFIYLNTYINYLLFYMVLYINIHFRI